MCREQSALPSESAADQESFAYNALGQTKEKTDRNGTVHDYLFDQLGRPTDDVVSTLGSGVDGAIRRIGTNYDTAGRVFQITSYSDVDGETADIVNQVERHYNGISQLSAEYQAHNGAVDVGTTPVVLYAYSEMEGGANHSRLVAMTYPDGRLVRSEYSAGIDDAISRLSFLADDNSGSVGTHLEELEYLGLGTVVARKHPEPGVDLTYVKLAGESNGDAGDQYTGLDRFSRIMDQRWINSTDVDVDRFGYGYDRNSNRLYRENPIKTLLSELYHANGEDNGYDLLNRLFASIRGELNAAKNSIASPTRSQDWSLDALGNWNSLTNDGGSPESRTHNAQNQVTEVGSNALTFDNNGNTTTDEQGRPLIYDAWNRFVTVKTAGNVLLAQYAHDGLNRRITEDSGTARELYYSSKWQEVEERESGIAVVQNVWSPVYIDAMILRDRDADANSGNGLEERLYSLHDANYNTTALVDASGAVIERFIQTPYGLVTYLDANFTPRMTNASTVDWQYLHQGNRLDIATVLYYVRNRIQSPTLGRWLQQDPIGYAAGDRNLYGYVGGRPTNGTDPSGLVDPNRPVFYIPDGQMRPGDVLAYQSALLIEMARKRAWAEAANNPPVLLRPQSSNGFIHADTRSQAEYERDRLRTIWTTTSSVRELREAIDADLMLTKQITYAHMGPWERGAVLYFGPNQYQPGLGSTTYFEQTMIAALGGYRLMRGPCPTANAPSSNLTLETRESWGRSGTLADHFARHGADFGSTSAESYAQQASRFLQESQVRGLPTKIGPDGAIRVYDASTNTFGSYNASGTTRTFYKPNPAQHGYPTNLDYCNSQVGAVPWIP